MEGEGRVEMRPGNQGTLYSAVEVRIWNYGTSPRVSVMPPVLVQVNFGGDPLAQQVTSIGPSRCDVARYVQACKSSRGGQRREGVMSSAPGQGRNSLKRLPQTLRHLRGFGQEGRWNRRRVLFRNLVATAFNTTKRARS